MTADVGVSKLGGETVASLTVEGDPSVKFVGERGGTLNRLANSAPVDEGIIRIDEVGTGYQLGDGGSRSRGLGLVTGLKLGQTGVGIKASTLGLDCTLGLDSIEAIFIEAARHLAGHIRIVCIVVRPAKVLLSGQLSQAFSQGLGLAGHIVLVHDVLARLLSLSQGGNHRVGHHVNLGTGTEANTREVAGAGGRSSRGCFAIVLRGRGDTVVNSGLVPGPGAAGLTGGEASPAGRFVATATRVAMTIVGSIAAAVVVVAVAVALTMLIAVAVLVAGIRIGVAIGVTIDVASRTGLSRRTSLAGRTAEASGASGTSSDSIRSDGLELGRLVNGSQVSTVVAIVGQQTRDTVLLAIPAWDVTQAKTLQHVEIGWHLVLEQAACDELG